MNKKISPGEKKEDFLAPGKVYICQASEKVSCGACCGLYNVADPSKMGLTVILRKRTLYFEETPLDVDSILGFKERVEERENPSRPFPKFHHCPYLGFVGKEKSRVGCLLHPLNEYNDGLDFRGLSHYGTMACRQYFCPTHTAASAAYKELIRDAAPDWCIYGLVITESEMINNFFFEIEKRLRRPLKNYVACADQEAAAVIQKFLMLKIEWPFRAQRGFHPVNYFFKDRLYDPPEIDYHLLKTVRSKYDPIFKALRSEFSTRNSLLKAESMVDSLIDRLTGIFKRNKTILEAERTFAQN